MSNHRTAQIFAPDGKAPPPVGHVLRLLAKGYRRLPASPEVWIRAESAGDGVWAIHFNDATQPLAPAAHWRAQVPWWEDPALGRLLAFLLRTEAVDLSGVGLIWISDSGEMIGTHHAEPAHTMQDEPKPPKREKPDESE